MRKTLHFQFFGSAGWLVANPLVDLLQRITEWVEANPGAEVYDVIITDPHQEDHWEATVYYNPAPRKRDE